MEENENNNLDREDNKIYDSSNALYEYPAFFPAGRFWMPFPLYFLMHLFIFYSQFWPFTPSAAFFGKIRCK